jgi:APA family basic amino acid/polyamine antiporter
MMLRTVRRPTFGLWSGIGLIVANTIGVGVLTSAGYMAKDLGPGQILAVWAIGGLIALAGAVCYGHIAAQIPRSGGEYRYLSTLLHPAVGYLAGWASLLVGFSAPVAIAAYAAGCFAEAIDPRFDARGIAIAVIVGTTLLHAISGRVSSRSQNALAGAKVVAFVGLLGAALIFGAHRWPDWQPPVTSDSSGSGFPTGPFFIALVYVAYAYSGWNTTIYAAEEMKEPRKTVPRAMILGTLAIALLYLAVNWVFVSNLSSTRMAAFADGDTQRVTLAHFVTADIAGPAAADLISIVLILMLVSSISAMTVVGPHVYSSMAKDGLLPKILIRRDDQLPVASVLVQSGLAVAMLMTHSFDMLVVNIGAMLTLTSALTVICVLRMRPRPFVLACAGAYTIASCWILYFVFTDSPVTLAWAVSAVVAGLVGWYLSTSRVSPDTSGAQD